MAILTFQSSKTRDELSVVTVLAEAVPGEGNNLFLICFVATPTCSKYDGEGLPNQRLSSEVFPFTTGSPLTAMRKIWQRPTWRRQVCFLFDVPKWRPPT